MSICTDRTIKIYDGNEVKEERIAVDIISGRRVRNYFLEETILAFAEMLKQELKLERSEGKVLAGAG